MADNRRFFPNQQLDLAHILQEAQQRWLRPTEICEILRNYQKFQLTPDPPVKPAAGSLFLFDRKALRYFRKDGHRWRKKKDGKTVREAHEKLKAGSVDVLHCYYAHGEDNENFQRRSYWMLDGQLEHIVLVHYREVKEGYKSGISRVQNADPCSQIESPQGSSAPFLAQGNSPAPTVQTSYGSSPNTVDWSGQTVSSEFDDGDSGEDPGTSSLTQPLYGSVGRKISLHGSEVAGSSELSKNHLGSEFAAASSYHGTEPSLWGAMHNSSRDVHSAHDQKYYFEQPSGADLMTHKLIDARLDTGNAVQDVALGDRMIPYIDNGELKLNSERVFQWPQVHDFNLVQPQLLSSFRPQTIVTSAALVNPSSREVGSNNVELGELKKLDSFGRWMDKEIGRDCDDSLMASDSGNYWNTLDAQNDDKEVSSLSRHMQLDIGSLGPSLSQEQLFSINDFSPDWAYSGVETKVLITGTFLGNAKRYTSCKWSCMFGEIEVSAEVLTENVIRCRAPLHVTGRVPIYVTCSNRLACSEVREFEYRENPMGVAFSMSVKCAPEDEMRFQIRLAKMLCTGFERKWMDCSIQDCDKCKLKKDIYLIKREHETDWEKIEEDSGGNYTKAKDVLIQNLLKDRLCEWLVCKIHEGGKGAHILDDQGQGPIHLAAALGYEWAMGPIVAAGVSPSFRDARGRTGLHWASYFGREATVITLVRLGAAPGAVEDPTPAFPGGQTAADLASSRGHKGIAGYLAEADLTSHLSLLTVCGSVKDSFAANIAAEKAIESAAQTAFPSDRATEEELSLKGSLAAVRNSARAAALIQAAFRSNSFRHRQSTKANDDISEVPLDLVALGSLSKVQKMGHFQDYLHSAAVRIQQKYRGWKGRKEFLKIRSRIVKIQAHVRGHQVRKQYKKVVWSVSIVEKAVLRWRRKRPGLRGFRVNLTIENSVSEAEKSDEYEFLRIGRKQKFAGVEKALARVQSMVRHPEAREQYMRMVAKFDNVKMGDEESSASHD